MLSALRFDSAAPPRRETSGRTDVACFVGSISRRPGVSLSAAERATLRDAGWIDGPHAVASERLESLHHLPIVVDGWNAFDRLFAWDERPLHPSGEGTCATWLGAAVRAFFTHGGRRAVVISTGAPWPYLGGTSRNDRRTERLTAILPATDSAARPFTPVEPSTWLGMEHLYGLAEVSHLILTDLADLCSAGIGPTTPEHSPPPPQEGFVECSPIEPPPPPDTAVRGISPPRLGAAEYRAWAAAVGSAREFLSRYRRDALLLAALPLAARDTRAGGIAGSSAGRDMRGFLDEMEILAPTGIDAGTSSASVQLVWPWLETPRTSDLPASLEPADGLLAGVLAANALSRGTHRSVAGTRLRQVVRAEPELAAPGAASHPVARLAERVCVIGRESDGYILLSDVTTSSDQSWRPGGVSRLMAAVLRAARRTGEGIVFDANGPALWGRVRAAMEELLLRYHSAGAFAPRTATEAFTVRCDRSTMTPSDLDSGRVRVEISLVPAHSITRITVALDLQAGQAGEPLSEVA